MDNSTISIDDIALGEYDKYNAHMDYNPGDYLMKILLENKKMVAKKQPMQNFLSAISSKITASLQISLYSFLNLLLVKNRDFLVKYYRWLEEIAKLHLRAKDLENVANTGMRMHLHKGMVIHTALADTERKMIEQFGGSKWKRIMNFPLLVSNEKKSQVGSRGGESFVSLTSENIPNHRHTFGVNKDSGGDKWKRNRNGSNVFAAYGTPGMVWSEKPVYPEISSLNWNEDFPSNFAAPITGAARYVKPHFNIPPYKDVYIWECEEPLEERKPNEDAFRFPEEEHYAVDSDVFTVLKTRGTSVINESIEFGGMTKLTDTGADSFIGKIKKNEMAALDALNGWATFVSDDLAAENETRYESKDAPVPDLASLMSWDIWCNTMHIEQTYLFKHVYKYLIEDIQDRIYLLMERIINATNAISSTKHRVSKGEYVFLYGTMPNGKTESQVLKDYYKLPAGSSFVKVTGVFLRGTSMFTEENKQLFDEYVLLDKENKSELKGKLTTSGGLSTVNLYSDNFPKHLHWSTLLSGLNSATVELSNKTNGGEGTSMMMNDPRSGGFKYGTSAGSGPYKVEVKNYGATNAISHNNMPQYITMSVYLVS